MAISQKCVYALCAVHELARSGGTEPMKIGDIAERQQIPMRFLEVILNQLKQGGFVQSRRGNEGGYLLARPADRITVGELIRFVEGPLAPVDCDAPGRGARRGQKRCPFAPLWKRAEQALAEVYDQTSVEDLVRLEKTDAPVTDFVI